jgi:hypothetical protein
MPKRNEVEKNILGQILGVSAGILIIGVFIWLLMATY